MRSTWLTIAVLLATSSAVQAQDSWENRSNMLRSRNDHASAGWNGYLYVFGGTASGTGGWYHSLHRYDPATNSWSELNGITDYDGITPVGWTMAGGVAHDGKLYQFAGYVRVTFGSFSDNTAWKYDIAGGSWTRITASVPYSFTPCRAAVAANKIYVTGYSVLNRVENYEFDPATEAWATKPALTRPLSNYCIAGLNGKVYIAGGESQSTFEYTSEMWEYTPGGASWVRKADLPMASAYGAGSAARGRVFAMGGWNNSYADNMAYDPVANSWAVLAPMPVGGYFHSAAAATSGGRTRVYVTGGSDDTAWLRNRCDAYDPPSLPKPSDPAGLFMRRVGQAENLPEGAFTGTSIVLGAILADPNGCDVSLEVEAAPVGGSYTGTPTAVSAFGVPGEYSVQLDALSGGGWKWRARCRNSNEEVNPADWVEFGAGDPDFIVDLQPPTTPGALSPADGGVAYVPSAQGGKVTFSWTAAIDDSPDPVSYYLQVSADPSFSTILAVGTATGAESADVYLVPSAATRYWRVRSSDSGGNTNGIWSSVNSFRVDLGSADGGDDKKNVPCSNSAAGTGSLAVVFAAGAGALALLRRR